MLLGILKCDLCYSFFIYEYLIVENKNLSMYLWLKIFRYGRELVIVYMYIIFCLIIKKEVFDYKKRCKGVKI